MSDRQVKQIQRIIEQGGVLGFLKLTSEVIGNKVIIENVGRDAPLNNLYIDFVELYRRWYAINNRYGATKLP